MKLFLFAAAAASIACLSAKAGVIDVLGEDDYGRIDQSTSQDMMQPSPANGSGGSAQTRPSQTDAPGRLPPRS
jgi:hypothetical protein